MRGMMKVEGGMQERSALPQEYILIRDRLYHIGGKGDDSHRGMKVEPWKLEDMQEENIVIFRCAYRPLKQSITANTYIKQTRRQECTGHI